MNYGHFSCALCQPQLIRCKILEGYRNGVLAELTREVSGLSQSYKGQPFLKLMCNPIFLIRFRFFFF